MIIVQLLHSYVLLYSSKWQLPPLEKTAAATFFHTLFQKSGANKEARQDWEWSKSQMLNSDDKYSFTIFIIGEKKLQTALKALNVSLDNVKIFLF